MTKPIPTTAISRQQAYRAGKRAVTIYVAPEDYRELRLLAAETDRTVQSLGTEAIQRLTAQADFVRRRDEAERARPRVGRVLRTG